MAIQIRCLLVLCIELQQEIQKFNPKWVKFTLSASDTSINPAETGFYYLNSRYYNPEVGRFICADTTDVLTASSTALTDKNLYSYCDNNPVVRKDTGGDYWETAFDIASLAVTASEIIEDPTDPLNYVALTGDIIDVLTPVAGIGETIKAVRAVDKLSDSTRVIAKIENLSKAGRMGKQARLRELSNDHKLSSALRGEIKRDINQIKRGKRRNIRVPSGYELSHRMRYSARKGYSYKYLDLNMKKQHRKHHSILDGNFRKGFNKYGKKI